jgi:hypothetical protein
MNASREGAPRSGAFPPPRRQFIQPRPDSSRDRLVQPPLTQSRLSSAKRCAIAVCLCASSACLPAVEVVDTFETAGNPNQWGWANTGGGVYTLQPTGGNPDGWLDSGPSYFTDHPNLTSIPPAGSDLRRALDSAALTGASYDFKRLDAGDCFPQNDTASTFALGLIDLHSDPGGAVITAYVNGKRSPTRPSGWRTVSFTIPSDSVGVPDGWVLNAPAQLNYTWSDLMHNVDGISFLSVSPDDVTFSSCWRLGADNVSVTYGENIFANGFE